MTFALPENPAQRRVRHSQDASAHGLQCNKGKKGRWHAVLRVPTRGQDPAKVAQNVLYSVRIDDQPGWYDRSFSNEAYLHGQRDHATLTAPQGVSGPSGVLRGVLAPVCSDSNFQCSVPWKPNQEVNYEIHAATMTPEGTFDAAINRLPHVASVATTVQVMPLGMCSGPRNWGYDTASSAGTNPHDPPGGWRGFRRFNLAAHKHGLRTILDMQYNHQGPEGDSRTLFTNIFPEHHRWGHGVASPKFPNEFDAIVEQAATEMMTVAQMTGVDGVRLDHTQDMSTPLKKELIHAAAEIGKTLGETLHADVRRPSQ